jgi:hypothetical protein
MKKIKTILGLFAFALLLSACAQEDGALYENPDGATKVSLASTRYIADLVPEDGTEIKLAVQRTDANGAFDARFSFKTNSSLFTMADTVAHFTNGETTTYLTVTHAGSEQMGVVDTYTLSVSLAADAADLLSPGGNSTQTLTIRRRLTWETGIGTWKDGIISSIFSGVPALTYPVSVQQAEEAPGLYRMVNPYGFEVYEFTESGDVVSNPCYVLIDATNPNEVFIDRTGIGIDYGYGEISIVSAAYATHSGKTITFPVQALFFSMPDYNSGTLYYVGGECILTLP